MKSSGPSELGVVMRPGGMIRRPVAPVAKAQAATVAETTRAITSKIFIRGLNVAAECGTRKAGRGL
jgi:7,8-dihydroneopterin aldolase/epimerase/oxygenase